MNSVELFEDIYILIAQKATIATRIILRLTCKELHEKLKFTLNNIKTPSSCGTKPLLTSLIAYDGSFELLRDVVVHGCAPDGQTCVAAAENGNQEMLKWLRKLPNCVWYSPISYLIAYYAARQGNLRITKWALRHTTTHETIGYAAARGGHLELLKWLLDTKHMVSDILLVNHAARGGHRETISWLTNILGYKLMTHTFVNAILHGDINFLDWLLKRGCPCDTRALVTAVRMGNSAIVSWMLDRGCPRSEEATLEAARMGHLDIFALLLNKGVPMDLAKCLWHAGANGQIAILDLMSQVAMRSHYVTAWRGAAQEGQVAVLYWALERGNSFQEEISSIAASHGETDVLKLLIEFRQPISKDIVTKAIQSGKVTTVDFLLSIGKSLEPDMIQYAIEIDAPEMVRFLYNKGLHLSPKTRSHIRQKCITESSKWGDWMKILYPIYT